ncbi:MULTISPECIES: hypothetical protein [Rhodobacterales]|uniref:hypothetical protein n=1 Tax=Rhodobacterales TaxID=204455 RepID=UPI0015F028BB|nr:MULTISPECIES: hypothetical protein [Rhodobacterales]MDO6591128.1 hypothetical protein [Yoonia sp. 1_MG-2023]
MRNNKIAVFIRTHAFTPQVAQLAATLTDGFGSEVTMIVDERSGPIETQGHQKISLTEELVRSWGIASLPKDWGWLCGDFCCYAARAAVPDANWYVLIESDVFVTLSAAQILGSHLSQTEADALACSLGRTDAPKIYSKDLEHLGVTSHCGCIFAVTCIRDHVIDEMLPLRVKAQRTGNYRINDEAVLAGALISNDLSFEDLFHSLPNLFSPNYFETNPPHLYEAMPIAEANQSVVHPTIPLDLILERIKTGEKNYSRHRLRKVLREAPRGIRVQIKAALNAKSSG